MYELTIIGGGPAGVAAGVYAGRKHLKTLFLTNSFGGQSTVSSGIENWIGEVNISGNDLAKKLEDHLRAYAGEFVDIKPFTFVNKVSKIDGGFSIETSNGTFESKTVLVATGSSRKKIEAKNADKFEHKGLTYCASCDGPMFKNKDLVVIGGGNSAFESASQLLEYANSVTIIHRRNEFRAEAITVEKMQLNPKFKVIKNAEITEIIGDFMVSGLKYLDKNTNTEIEIKCDGVFVEIGATPSVGFVKDLVKLSANGTVEIDPWNQKTSVEGIWAAGDCTNILYHQNNIATGDAVRALEDIFVHLKA